MAVPILWAPGIFWFFLLENPMPIKFLVLGGEGSWVFLRMMRSSTSDPKMCHK